MKKLFNLQKLMGTLFTVVAISLFIFSLWFLTDFKDLFGLELKMNRNISILHNNVLQPFNTELFWFGFVTVCSVLLIILLELKRKVPDLFALIVMDIVLAAGVVASLWFFHRMSLIQNVYLSLDYAGVALEGASEYIVNDRAFIIGKVLTASASVVYLAYGAVLAASHIRFRKEVER